MRGGSAGGPIRGAVAGVLVLALIGLIAHAQQVRDDNAREAAAHEARVQALKERWLGSPAIWQPPPIATTTIQFFDVTGVNQKELIDSLNGSDLCRRFPPCAPDPLNPTGVAWGLEGTDSVTKTYVCSSPGTTTIQFQELMVLPRWKPPADGTVTIPLVVKWNALQRAIYVHESGHVAITKAGVAALNDQAHRLTTCAAFDAFWKSPKLFDKIDADQIAYHTRLHADCRPEIGCIPPGWMGW